MANFARVRPVWADNTDLLFTEMQLIDDQLSVAVSGEGGVYALTEDLVIGGDPGTEFEITIPFNCFGDAAFTGQVTMSDDVTIGNGAADALTVNAVTTFQRNVTLVGSAELRVADTIYGDGGAVFSGVVSLNDDLLSYGANTFYGANAFEGVVTCNDVVNLNDVVNFSSVLNADGNVFLGTDGVTTTEFHGTTQIYGPTKCQQGGKINRRAVQGANANTTYRADTYEEVFDEGAGVLTGDVSYTISDTNCEDGAEIEFSNWSAHVMTIKRPGGATLTVLPATGPVSWVGARRVTCRREGGIWYARGFALA